MRLSQNMTCMQAKPGLLKLIGWEREVPAWHAALTRALDNDTRLVGPAISCEGMHRGGDPDGEWRANPHVLSHAIAVEQVGRVLPGFVQVPVQGPCAASSPCMPKAGTLPPPFNALSKWSMHRLTSHTPCLPGLRPVHIVAASIYSTGNAAELKKLLSGVPCSFASWQRLAWLTGRQLCACARMGCGCCWRRATC